MRKSTFRDDSLCHPFISSHNSISASCCISSSGFDLLDLSILWPVLWFEHHRVAGRHTVVSVTIRRDVGLEWKTGREYLNLDSNEGQTNA